MENFFKQLEENRAAFDSFISQKQGDEELLLKAYDKLSSKSELSFKKQVLVLGNNSLGKEFAKNTNFKTRLISSKDVKSVEGKLGNVELFLKSGELLSAYLAVSFVGPKFAEFSGLLRADKYSDDELLLKVNTLCDTSYRPLWEETYCDLCKLCEKACDELAITCEGKKILIDESKCVKCGSCVSVCPQGSISRKELGKELLRELFMLLKGKGLLLVSDACMKDLSKLKLSFENTNVLSLATLNLSLDEYLLMVQELGFGVVVYDTKLCKEAKENIGFINEVSKKLFGKETILNSSLPTQEELDSLKPCEGFSYLDDHHFARGNLAQRLKAWVKQDAGTVQALLPTFMDLSVDEDACTLCMACASVCKSYAFFGSKQEEALKFTAINCTHCDICLKACPEKCIQIKAEGLKLSPAFFEPKSVAKDEKFLCIMCHEAFATKKSIERVAKQMKPLFANDERKLKSLYCCPTCKVKVMLSSV